MKRYESTKGDGWELRLGDWRKVLGDVEADVLLSDPPYSPRQIAGFRSSKSKNNVKEITQDQISYSSLSHTATIDVSRRFEDVRWTVLFSDHIAYRWWEESLTYFGRYVFAPVIWIKGNNPRFQGDGPCSAAEYICVSRLREKTTVGSLPGWYKYTGIRHQRANPRIVIGEKPLDLMRALVRDYTQPDDLIVDPFAGSGTTLLAAAIEGRRAIGAELDPTTYNSAVARLTEGYTPILPGLAAPHQERQSAP